MQNDLINNVTFNLNRFILSRVVSCEQRTDGAILIGAP
jgi:hypothetical protein